MRTVAVVGASLAGLSSARALRSQGFDGRLVVIGDELHRPYDRPPLSKEFLAGTFTRDDLALEDADEDLGVEWLLGVRAESLDLTERTVVLADGKRVRADGVVVATGARARTLAGTERLAGVHTLRTLDDAVALRAEVEPGRRLVVIGAGFIGAEVASTARALGLDVTVVEALATPLAGPLGTDMGVIVSALHADHGVRLICGTGVRGFTGVERVDGVALDDGRVLPADLVLVGVGAQPNVEWLQGSGLELDNGVRCDVGGLTSSPGVVAVGDCAAWYDRRLGRHHRVEHWTGALDRPKRAVATLLSGDSSGPDAAPPYFWSDQYGVRLQFAGDARSADTVTIEDGDPADRCFLAVYRRDQEPVGVLGMNQVRAFTRWRRMLGTASVVAPS
ncbi:NAD(P)/FAD-dependent oxidoreductase [Terrabacter sp. MAHUQ-38]|uniref:NAD(P)/FAD-dependent oxidoreductase n=1 Tax=unclassified Terrabacter TaxID=2630222 RepID=UPI00165DD005|nr:FAD-dependent oxidoreductase [Terrabacter sp. MAHUQ-38]MBC9821111.1 FAD-dependent oxidoreductase [Terrabacter sp. MAHUQ-38]